MIARKPGTQAGLANTRTWVSWLAACLFVTTIATDRLCFASGPDDLPPNLWTRTKGHDWPSFLGPNRNGRSPETGIRVDWKKAPPRVVWTRELGEGYGIGSVSRGRFFQLDRHMNRARLQCLHAETGKTLWTFEYNTYYVDSLGYNGGPRCSPVIDGQRVYIFGAEGMLHCLDALDGSLYWKCDTAKQFGVVQNFFGVGSTPIIDDQRLIVIVGGSPAADRRTAPSELNRVRGNGTGIVAFDKRTGDIAYSVTDELAGYASPVVATIGSRRWCFAFCRGGLVGLDPTTGEVDFRYPWRSRQLDSVNASTPLVVGDEVFISETYGPGSSLLRFEPGGHSVIWQDDPKKRHRAMQAHWNTPIYHEGYLYGCSGRHSADAELRCIEWRTGKVMWSRPDRVRSSLLYVDQHAVCLDERGVLSLIRLSPIQCEEVSRTILVESGGDGPAGSSSKRILKYPCWSAPILAHGLLYVRGRGRLVCLELTSNITE